jgi:hypothetical protein
MNGLAALTKTTTMALLLGLALYASDAVGQQAKINKTELVGTWTLASNTNTSPGGQDLWPERWSGHI